MPLFRSKAEAKVAEAQAQLDAAKAAAEPKVEALTRAREEAVRTALHEQLKGKRRYLRRDFAN